MSDFMHNYLAKQTLSIGNHIWPNVCPFYLPSLLLCDNIYIGHELILFLCAGPIPSSIYSWSIDHILEHEFFSLGRLGSQGSKGKKWI